MNDADLSTTALLEAHGDWVRRLARSLLTDPASADDVAQDTWEVTLRQGPRHAGALRAWLGRIATNQARNLTRGRARRQAREREVAALAETTAPSPEDLTGAVELQRRLAAVVAELEESQRRVVYLRYFEGLDSPEIAGRLGIAAGTVRWRLKNAINEIRRRLDEGSEAERRRWRALLLPVAAGARPSVPAPLRAAGGRWFGPGVLLPLAGLSLLALLLVGLSWLRSAPGPGVAAGSGRAGGGPPRFQDPASMPAAVAAVTTSCPGLRDLEARAQQRRRELESRDSHKDLFARAAPNPTAQARFGAAHDEALRRIGKCEHTIECRGLICKVQLLVPLGLTTSSCLPDSREPWLGDRLDTHRSLSGGNDTPVVDPLSKKSFTRHDMYYRLASVTGDPVPRDKRPPLPPIAPGLGQPGEIPAGLSAECRNEARQLLEEIARLETSIAAQAMPAEAFAASEPNPGLVASTAREVARLLGLGDKPLPFQVTCRGSICALAPTAALDPALAIEWDCQPVAPGRPQFCNPSRGQDDWAIRLRRGLQDSAVLAEGFPPLKRDGEEVPAYVRVRPAADRDRVNPLVHGCKMIDEIRAARLLERCEASHPQDRGKLTVKLTYPAPDTPLVDGRRRVGIDVGDELGPTPIGRCVADSVRALMDRHEVPELRNGMVNHRHFTFPNIAAYWSRPSSCDGVKR
jgi:RNA polymerase sigma factor (sigma-70 family)